MPRLGGTIYRAVGLRVGLMERRGWGKAPATLRVSGLTVGGRYNLPAPGSNCYGGRLGGHFGKDLAAVKEKLSGDFGKDRARFREKPQGSADSALRYRGG